MGTVSGLGEQQRSCYSAVQDLQTSTWLGLTRGAPKETVDILGEQGLRARRERIGNQETGVAGGFVSVSVSCSFLLFPGKEWKKH